MFGLPVSSDAKLLLLYYIHDCREKSLSNEHFKKTASKLGWSEDRYGRAFAELKAGGFVSRKSNGPGKVSTVSLLWHPSLAPSLDPKKPNNRAFFESADSRSLESAESRTQPEPLNPQIQPLESAESGVQSPQICGQIKERGFSFQGSFQGTSSSKEASPVVEQPRTAEQPNPNDDEAPSLSIEPTEAEAEHPWSEDEIEFVRGTIARHRHAPYEPTVEQLPDMEFTARYLSHFRDFEDFKLYWLTRGRQLDKPKKPSHGLYATDVEKHWKPLRDQYRQEAAADPGEFVIHHGNLKGVSATVARLMTRPEPVQTPRKEWCRACAAEQPCQKHNPQPEPEAPPKPAGEPKHYRRAVLLGDLKFQREALATCKIASLREWSENKIREIEAELAALDNGDGTTATATESPTPAATTAHTHRRPQGRDRGRPAPQAFGTLTKVSAIGGLL